MQEHCRLLGHECEQKAEKIVLLEICKQRRIIDPDGKGNMIAPSFSILSYENQRILCRQPHKISAKFTILIKSHGVCLPKFRVVLPLEGGPSDFKRISVFKASLQ